MLEGQYIEKIETLRLQKHNIKSKKNRKNPKLATLSLINLMIAQGKKIQAKKNLKLIVKHSTINKNVIKAEEMLKDL